MWREGMWRGYVSKVNQEMCRERKSESIEMVK